MKVDRTLLLGTLCLLASACAEGGDAMTPGATDEWGGTTGTSMDQPGTGDFGMSEESEDPSESDPSEDSIPDSDESPAEEDPSTDPMTEEGDPVDTREESTADTAGMGTTPTPPTMTTPPAPDTDPGTEPPSPTTPTDMDYLAADGAYTTAAPTVRRAWFVTPRGTPIFLNGVNTVYSESHQIHIGAYLASSTPAAQWTRMSARSGFGLNWIGSWVSADNPVIAAADSRAPYGAVLHLSPAQVLHRHGNASEPVVLRTDGQPMSARGHWLRDPHQEDGRNVLCGGISRQVFGDPFNPDYQLEAEAELERQIAPHRRRANLVMYYMGNEQGLGDWTRERRSTQSPDAAYCARGTGIVDLRRFLWTECPQGSSIDVPMCAPHALGFFLKNRYGTVEAMNTAWGNHYTSFDTMLADRPEPDTGVRGDDLADFALILVRQWVRVTTEAIRHSDTTDGITLVRQHSRPVASPRLAIASDRAFRFYSLGARADRWTSGLSVPDPHARRNGAMVNTTAWPELDRNTVRFDPYRAFGRYPSQPNAGFDVVSVNVYTGSARFPERWLHAGFQRLRAVSDRSVMVSEFGLRLRDTCWSNSGGAGSYVGETAPYRANDPRDVVRGRRYVSQVRQFIREGAVAVSWHRWADDEQNPGPNPRRVAACGNAVRRNGQRKGFLRGNGARYEGLYRAVHALNNALYTQLHSARNWWQ